MFKRPLALLALLILMAPAGARAAVTLLDKDQWKVTMGGFIEMDMINDSVRSFTETVGNNPVDRTGTVNGEKGRTQFSIRNSRLDFGVEAPEVDGWKTRGYFEFDLLGYDPSTTLKSSPVGASSPSSIASTNTEAAFFDNPTFRVRHAFLSAESNGWQLLAGQYWALLGWQPYYFMPSIEVAPVPAMLYSRTPQLRAVKAMELGESQSLQAAIGVMRPPQRDSEIPGLELGARWILNSRSAGFTGGSTGAMKTQPMSVGVSGTLRELQAPTNASASALQTTDFPGAALSVDALIPVLASSDGKDVSNTLTLGGEFSTGEGYGDEFNGWTGNLPSPLNSSPSLPYSAENLDAGIGGYDASGAFGLVHLMTWNAYLQYHLNQAARTAFSVGASQLYSNNIDGFLSSSPGKVLTYDRTQGAFANVMHDFSDQIRVGAEYAFIRTTYSDGEQASDNRYQVSLWYIF